MTTIVGIWDAICQGWTVPVRGESSCSGYRRMGHNWKCEFYARRLVLRK